LLSVQRDLFIFIKQTTPELTCSIDFPEETIIWYLINVAKKIPTFAHHAAETITILPYTQESKPTRFEFVCLLLIESLTVSLSLE
jgi:hypothetical protein